VAPLAWALIRVSKGSVQTSDAVHLG